MALYDRVADSLRRDIVEGTLAPGQRLRTEMELAASFRVSRVTVRKAIQVLRDEGMVVVRQGLGSFVRAPRAQQAMDHLETLEASLAGQGLEPITHVVAFAFTTPSASVRRALALKPEDSILQVRRLHSVPDGPLGVVDLSLPADIGRLLSREDVERRPFFELLPMHGISLGPAQQVIRAEAASAEIAGISGISENSPVLVCERVTHDGEARPIIHALFTYRSDRFEFRIDLSAGGGGTTWVPLGLVPKSGNADPPSR